ncbi:hypothetical protein [Prevotella sp. P2-180]|uniref:hypothetical protein n=1 Tax=Prevotella sp. P2-180 TaxID=2024224 RepID=UPI000B96A3D0|nr:hypothetical protein [Prevotella sp. P2-180]OYP66952.1 hypothetical protein CIK98_06025 [Prevotella sp. P2-180]
MRASTLVIKYLEKDVEKVRCEVSKWQFMSKLMGEQYITFTCQSENPIPFKVGDFCVYRGQTYTLNYIPSAKQKARPGEIGDAFVYDSVKMDSVRDELGRVIMLDITPTTGDYVAALGTNYTGSAVFSLYCGESTALGKTLTPVCALAAKMQANLDRAYPKSGWKVLVDTESKHEEGGTMVLNTHTDEKVLSFDNTTVASALSEVKNTFDLNFCVVGRTIYIGYTFGSINGDADGNYFYYGYGKGHPSDEQQGTALFQIKRTSNANQQIVTRLRAMGSTKNMPYRYYNKKYNLSQSMFPTNLQLPDTFETPAVKEKRNAERKAIYPFLRSVLGDTNDAFIEKNDDCMSTVEGLREESARWDGSNSELEEIYPSIYEATYGELRAANCEDMDGATGSSAFPNYLDDERIDEILIVDDNANIGDGIISESNISNETKNVTDVSVSYTEEQNSLSYKGDGYSSSERVIMKVSSQYAGKYILTYANLWFGVSYSLGRHQSENITKTCKVSYIIKVYATDVVSGNKTLVTQYKSKALSVSNRDTKNKEVEFVALPDVNEDPQQVSEIRLTSLSDVEIVAQILVTELDYTYDQYSINWYLDKSKYETADTTVDFEPSLIWDREDSAATFMNSPFHIVVKDMGFDFVAAFGTSETPRLSMKSGYCVAREFEIMDNPEKVSIEKDGKTYKGWKLMLKRCPDNSVGVYYPSLNTPIKPGDNYVLLNIEMPDMYVKAAEVKLLVEATKYLAKNCETKYQYEPSIDDIYLQRDYDLCEKEGRVEDSVYWKLYDGMTFPFYSIPDSADDELPLVNMVIESVTIKEGEGLTPKVEIRLNDDSEQSVLQKITQSISSSTSGSIFNAASGTGGGGLDTSSVRSLINTYGRKLFLSKTSNDTAAGIITFLKGLVSEGIISAKQGVEIGEFVTGLYTGTGAAIDEKGNAEVESLRVRSYLEVMELIINRLSAIEGDQILTEADTIEAVDDLGDGLYRLKLKEKWEGYFTAQVVGNVVKGIINTLASGSGVYYTSWMLVKDVDTATNQIVVQIYPDEDTPAGRNFPPCELMKIARWGNVADEKRQSCLYFSSSDNRILRLSRVTKPIIDIGNYGFILGELPEWFYDPEQKLPINKDGDAIYVKTLVYQNAVKMNYQGKPEATIVDRGNWMENPEEPYHFEAINAQTGVYETSDVWYRGCKWRCIKDCPTGAPRYDSMEWFMIEGNPDFTISIEVENGGMLDYDWFAAHGTDLVVTGQIHNQDVTADILDTDVSWTRRSKDAEGNWRVSDDEAWNALLRKGKTLHLTVDDISYNSSGLPQMLEFTATALLRDGVTAEDTITVI